VRARDVVVLLGALTSGCLHHHHDAVTEALEDGGVVTRHVHGPGYDAWRRLTHPEQAADAGVPDAGLPDGGDAAPSDAGPPPSPLIVEPSSLPPITARKVWSSNAPGVGTSSPRVVDLNHDGVDDVVLAGGVQGQVGWVYALDGRTGKQLWHAKLKEEAYATPALVDLDRDGTPDVVVGGRDFDGSAFSGHDGHLLWSLRRANPKAPISKRNFNGAVPVPDQDGDGVGDVVFSQGGSYDDGARVPGHVFVVSGATGLIVKDLASPDGREVYSMPAVLPGDGGLELLVGSGGETLPGHLFRLDAMTGTVRWQVASKEKGFIGSPAVYDFEGEGRPDVVVSSMEGTVLRVDGATGQVKWRAENAGHEAYASPGLGAFGGHGLGVVATFSKGVFPTYTTTSRLVWLDGETGEVLQTRVHGVYASCSPLVADLDGDGLDETIAVSMDSFTPFEGQVRSTVGIFDGHAAKAPRLALQVVGASASTPSVSDLDHDGTLDLVLAYSNRVERWALEVKGGRPPTVRWGAFRGPTQDGVLAR
jgi:outer membrane protein assembly factor BamB